MNNDVKTWADGHGRWHADVPDTRLGLSRAVRIIALELFDRSPQGSSFLEMQKYVEENIVSLPCETSGRVHFAEYAID